jgi:hypothetical protein
MKGRDNPCPRLPTTMLMARGMYYLFMEVSHVGECEVTEVKNPCTFKFFNPWLQSR